jgi:hypothetical protein
MCTLRNFPHAIEHCIEWARDLFAGSFANAVQEAAAFAAAPAAWLDKLGDEANLSSRRAKAAAVLDALAAAKGANWAWCVAAARRLAHEHFTASIKQLLHNFPADYADPKTGVRFWSPPKRTPEPAAFDAAAVPEHAAFVAHAAALFAANFGVAPPPAGAAGAAATAAALAAAEAALPPWAPRAVRIKTDEADATVEGGDDDAEAVAAATASLRAAAADGAALAALRLAPAEFEKDDDANHHIAFITAAANLRAANYRIPPASFFQVKLIAGKIIPAVATTTGAVTGLVGLELLKIVAARRPAADARNTFMNLAINVYSASEPAPPKRTKSVANDPISMGPVRALPEGFTRWDRVKVAGAPDMTPAGLADWLAANHGGVRLSMLTYGRSILYNPSLYRAHAATRANKPLRAIIEEVSGKPIDKVRGRARAAGAGRAVLARAIAYFARGLFHAAPRLACARSHSPHSSARSRTSSSTSPPRTTTATSCCRRSSSASAERPRASGAARGGFAAAATATALFIARAGCARRSHTQRSMAAAAAACVQHPNSTWKSLNTLRAAGGARSSARDQCASGAGTSSVIGTLSWEPLRRMGAEYAIIPRFFAALSVPASASKVSTVASYSTPKATSYFPSAFSAPSRAITSCSSCTSRSTVS